MNGKARQRRAFRQDLVIPAAAAALVLGALPTGPLYAAFPIAGGLLDTGASTANLMIFLSPWACLKIPQEIMELRFPGPELMGCLIEAAVRRRENQPHREEA